MSSGQRLLGLLFAAGFAVSSEAHAAPRSPISHEVFRYGCRSEIGLQEMTVFGNGTLRLKQGRSGQKSMLLMDVSFSDLAALIARMERLDLREAESFGGKLAGDWVEQCTLHLDLDGAEPRHFEFHRLDSLSLGLQRAVNLGQELIDKILMEATDGGLPRAYEAELGDYLRHIEGDLYEVVGFTSDGVGVELISVEQPLGMYIARVDLRRVFVGLEEAP